MIERDRELLARAATVNRHLGTVVADMMTRQDDGQLPAGDLHRLGEALAQLGADMMARASEITSQVVETGPERVVIDAPDE